MPHTNQHLHVSGERNGTQQKKKVSSSCVLAAVVGEKAHLRDLFMLRPLQLNLLFLGLKLVEKWVGR